MRLAIVAAFVLAFPAAAQEIGSITAPGGASGDIAPLTVTTSVVDGGAIYGDLLHVSGSARAATVTTGAVDGGAIYGDLLHVSGSARAATVTTGAVDGGTLRTAGPNVLGGDTVVVGVLTAGDAGVYNFTVVGFFQAQDAGFNRVHAEEFISHALPGADGFSAMNSGVHWQIGPGVNESFFGTGGGGPRTTGSFTAGGEISAGPEGYRVSTANTWKGNGYALDGGTAFQMLAGSMDFDAGIHTVWAVNDGGVYPVARMMADGYLASRTPATLISFYTNSVNNVGTYGGLCLPRPFTLTRGSVYVTGAAGAGTNDVLRVTDGANNCDFTFSCASDLNTTGAKVQAPTGSCAFAAGACLTISETTAGCTPDPTLKSILFQGWHQ